MPKRKMIRVTVTSMKRDELVNEKSPNPHTSCTKSVTVKEENKEESHIIPTTPYRNKIPN
jgi:hypothetical protein